MALNPDTGKMAWYFQPSPHDTHDWDAMQTPVLFDGVIDGKPRKLLAQASRNGYFFVLDRTNGKNILSEAIHRIAELGKGMDAKGQPIPIPDKYPKMDGVLVSPLLGRHQLAGAQLRSRYRPVLRGHVTRPSASST